MNFKPLGPNDVESYVNLPINIRNSSDPSNLAKYELPVTDTQRSRRNFEGYEKNQWYNLGDLQSGDYAGNTDTDSQTELDVDRKHKGEGGGGGYTPIYYKKNFKGGRSWKSSSPRKKGSN